jgi:hypothetical protein
MIKIFSKIYILLVFLILTLDSFLYPLPRFLDGRIFLLLMFLFLFILRIKKIKLLNKKFSNLAFFGALLLAGFSLSLMLLERFYGFQYVQNTFSLSYSRVFYLSLAASIFATYAQSFYLSKKAIKISIFTLPLFLTLLAFFIYIRNNQLFRLVIEDDHLVEYSQFFLLLFSSLISLSLRKFWWSRERFLGVLFLLLALGLFFVAGEEISWGQRLLNLETPEQLAEINMQEELTIHNIGSIFGYVYRAYMLIGLVGSTAWIFFKLIKKYLSPKMNKILSNLIPDWYLSPYFAAAFFYNYDRFYLNPRVGEALWEEPMELLLILGITIFFLIKYLRVYPKIRNKFLIKKN